MRSENNIHVQQRKTNKKYGQMGIELSDRVENIVGKKEKLLIMSNFSFSHNVFKSRLLLMSQNEYLWSKGLQFKIFELI